MLFSFPGSAKTKKKKKKKKKKKWESLLGWKPESAA